MFAQVSDLGCIDLGDRRSGVQISPARQRNCRLGVVLGPIGWGDGQWFSEPAFGGPAERSRLLGEPGFWVETTTEEVDPQSGGVDCWAPGFG